MQHWAQDRTKTNTTENYKEISHTDLAKNTEVNPVPTSYYYYLEIITRGSPETVIAQLAQIGRVVLENSIIYQFMGG